MNIVIGLIPALIWGVMPVVVNKAVKGGSYMQMLGAVIGTALTAAVVLLAGHPQIPQGMDFLLCVLSGAGWAVGTCGQFAGYGILGVSTAYPLSTGLQIAGSALLGWLVLHEWKTPVEILCGLSAVTIVIIGIVLTSRAFHQKKHHESLNGIVMLVLTTAGYWLYSLLPEFSHSGSAEGQLIPQALGMLLTGVILAVTFGKIRFEKKSMPLIARASVVGILYGVANLAYLVSMSLNGMVRAFLLSQLNVILATLGGIYILKEEQTVPFAQKIIGLACILAGCIMVQLI